MADGLAGAAGAAGAGVVAAGAAPGTPLITELGPRVPTMANPSAPSMNSAPRMADALVRTVAPCPGAKRRLAATAAERRGDIAALALLQQDGQQQQQADDHVQGHEKPIQHND